MIIFILCRILVIRVSIMISAENPRAKLKVQNTNKAFSIQNIFNPNTFK